MEAAGAHHAVVEVWVEQNAFSAAVDGDFGFEEFAGSLVLINQAPSCYGARGARGEVAAGFGQRNGADVFVELDLRCQLEQHDVVGHGVGVVRGVWVVFEDPSDLLALLWFVDIVSPQDDGDVSPQAVCGRHHPIRGHQESSAGRHPQLQVRHVGVGVGLGLVAPDDLTPQSTAISPQAGEQQQQDQQQRAMWTTHLLSLLDARSWKNGEK